MFYLSGGENFKLISKGRGEGSLAVVKYEKFSRIAANLHSPSLSRNFQLETNALLPRGINKRRKLFQLKGPPLSFK